MNPIFSCITLLLVFLCSSAFATDLTVFQLNDGSKIRGRLISFTNGRYTVETRSLGKVTISQDKVKLISREEESSSPGESGKGAVSVAGNELQGVVKEMQGNEEIMTLVRALQDDPELQALMKDPTVMNAISAGDFSTLMSNPQIMKLLQNPKIREIQKKLAP